jgi:hypothetical protein
VSVDRRDTLERIVVAPRPVRDITREAANDLQGSIARIEQWIGKSLPSGSRPFRALEVLTDAAESGRFFPDHRGDDSGLRAYQLAQDLKDIADTLPPGRVKDLRRDLEMCMSGPLIPDPAALAPLQAQTQLVVRAALVKAGVSPTQPTHSGSRGRKKPDILVENGLSTYAIEVKRPTAARNVVPRALDAAHQLLQAKYAGGIVLDVTDCLEGETPQAVDAEVLQRLESASAEFFEDGVGWKPGCKHVMMITVMARPTWRATPASTKGAEVVVHSTSAGFAFGTIAGSLDMIRGRWLRSIVATGLNRLGFTSYEGTA